MNQPEKMKMLDTLNDLISKTNLITVKMMSNNATKDQLTKELIELQDIVRNAIAIVVK